MALKNKILILRNRSRLIQKIRNFFLERNYWEAETPLLSPYPCVEEHIDSLEVLFEKTCAGKNFSKNRLRYLITSPEYCMKRLLAEGAGNCFQIGKVFRQGEFGELHSPEFTMLEWYKISADHFDLMKETSDLFALVLHTKKTETVTYEQTFKNCLSLDLSQCDRETLIKLSLIPQNLSEDSSINTQSLCDYLFSFYIQPTLGMENPVFVIDFPKEQAALAKINPDGKTAARFEGFYCGVELCNGYYELSGGNSVALRFQEINEKRRLAGKEIYEVDPDFLWAMENGFPDCAGVALGVDRLVMLALGAENIHEILAFDVN